MVKPLRFITLTTRMSPITVISVVEVVGVSPRGHTSGAPPVKSVASAISAKALSACPVMVIIGIVGMRLRASDTSSIISRVLPELEISNITSSGCNTPRSPCWASEGWRFTAGMPVLLNVVAMFMAICPALPMPEVTSFPLRRCTCSRISSTARSKSGEYGMLRIALLSASRI